MISKIGFGCFRLTPADQPILTHALRNGISLIDTAAHFPSEKTIGTTLSQLISNNELKRSVHHIKLLINLSY